VKNVVLTLQQEAPEVLDAIENLEVAQALRWVAEEQ